MPKTILLAVILCLSSTCSAVQFPRKIEIGGSILGRDGNMITDLEVGEVEEWDPIYPGYREWEEQWTR